ncbi:hypothetical protein FHR72_001733 [Mycolicibacterium iranicum]|uniref:Uncharacterized protein n=1 Tax=Mycolicibacterium iranicum TaxID=912594 RepID=A0A839Q796_MYCIR|nr:hypothetical protein [Mycolicibacterium iranicum]
MLYRFVMEGRPLRHPAQYDETQGVQVADIETRCRAAIAAASTAVGEINVALRAAASRHTAAGHRPPAGTPVEHRACGRILGVH